MTQGNGSPEHGKKLGIVVAGSLNKGVEVRLDGAASVEEMAVGRYAVIEGRQRRFFGMITDVSLGVVDPGLTQTPPDASDPFTAEVLTGTSTYGTLQVTPYLTIGGDAASIMEGPQPVKTVPSHYAPVYLAADSDIELVFGKEDKNRFFIGNPLDMETRLCLDLPEFVKRSNGIFGKSGTGKTFFTRILLAGMLQKSRAVNLIFDMHNEYGWKGVDERGTDVQALKQLFPSKVAVFTIDEENSRRRGVSTDFVVKIGYDEIKPEDISLLRQAFNLTELAAESVYPLARRFGKGWLEAVLELDDPEQVAALTESLHIHESTFQNLRRGLNMLRRLPFIVPHAPESAVDTILKYLEKGMNVVLEFGRFRDVTTYVLVANLLTRRIYDRYQALVEQATKESEKPQPLVITIEEAHKFLNPDVSSQTIFGSIAREMRKYNVTLLVIDQRPSGIDEEVMSQLGTKITFLMDNDRDIDSVLAGVSGKGELKSVLAKLATRQQALIFGHALPMPVAFQPCGYDQDFYKRLLPGKTSQQDTEELFG